MSNVTNAILTFGIPNEENEDEILASVNSFFMSIGFIKINGHEGGTKRFETVVCAGAFNYLDVDALVVHLSAEPWKRHGCSSAQLFIQEQDDDKFRLIDVYEDSE